MKVDQSHSRNILKKVWYPIRQTYSNFCNYRRAPLGSTLFCTGLGAIPLGSIFCLAPEILTQLCSVTPFLEPSTLLCFALEPSSLAPETIHAVLFSNRSQVVWHWSRATRLRVFDWNSKIEGILGSCGLASHTQSFLLWHMIAQAVSHSCWANGPCCVYSHMIGACLWPC
jgi:hypothetical protein